MAAPLPAAARAAPITLREDSNGDGEAPPRPRARTRRRAARIAIAAAALAAVVLGGWFYLGHTLSTQAPPRTAAPAAVPVEAAPVVRRDVPVELTGLGTVQPFNTVTLHTRVDGQLQKIRFTEGQEVKAGDVLAEIDPRPFQAQLDQAQGKLAQDEAQLANARRDLARFEPLAQKQDVSRQQLDTQKALVSQLEAAVRADQAAIEFARVQLTYTEVRAPIAGRIGLRLVDEGNIVHAADPGGLLVVNQIQPISVTFTVPGETVGQLLKASAGGALPAEALSRDGKTVLARGTVAVIDNQIDQATGTLKLKASFANEDRALWPGLFVNVRVRVDKLRQVVTVPADAVQRGARGTYVYVIRPDRTAELRWVKVRQIDDTLAVIDEGVRAGETVATSGHYRLQPGGPVDVRTDAERSAVR
jgi:membrane fusion protein, multidrug efflux system